MSENLEELKPVIRSIFLALGRRTTESLFRKEFYNIEGKSFNTILQGQGQTFMEFMKSIPGTYKP